MLNINLSISDPEPGNYICIHCHTNIPTAVELIKHIQEMHNMKICNEVMPTVKQEVIQVKTENIYNKKVVHNSHTSLNVNPFGSPFKNLSNNLLLANREKYNLFNHLHQQVPNYNLGESQEKNKDTKHEEMYTHTV